MLIVIEVGCWRCCHLVGRVERVSLVGKDVGCLLLLLVVTKDVLSTTTHLLETVGEQIRSSTHLLLLLVVKDVWSSAHLRLLLVVIEEIGSSAHVAASHVVTSIPSHIATTHVTTHVTTHITSAHISSSTHVIEDVTALSIWIGEYVVWCLSLVVIEYVVHLLLRISKRIVLQKI